MKPGTSGAIPESKLTSCDGGTNGSALSSLDVGEPISELIPAVNPTWHQVEQSGTSSKLLAIGFPSFLSPCCARS